MGSQPTSPVLGNSLVVNIKLGLLIQLIVFVVGIAVLYATGKSDAKQAMDLGKQAVATTTTQGQILQDMNTRLERLDQRQTDFQQSYERDANKYFRDFSDRYSNLKK